MRHWAERDCVEEQSQRVDNTVALVGSNMLRLVLRRSAPQNTAVSPKNALARVSIGNTSPPLIKAMHHIAILLLARTGICE
jgi:hypothetical protein